MCLEQVATYADILLSVFTFVILLAYLFIACYTKKQFDTFKTSLKTQYKPIITPVHTPGNVGTYPSFRISDDDLNGREPNHEFRESLFQIFFASATPGSSNLRKIALLSLKNIGGGPAMNIQGCICNGRSSIYDGNRISNNQNHRDCGDIFGANMLGSGMTQVFQCELSPNCLDQENVIQSAGRYDDGAYDRVFYLNITYENIFGDEKYRLTAFFSPHDTGRWEEIEVTKI